VFCWVPFICLGSCKPWDMSMLQLCCADRSHAAIDAWCFCHVCMERVLCILIWSIFEHRLPPGEPCYPVRQSSQAL
jgi:hypothetical protein